MSEIDKDVKKSRTLILCFDGTSGEYDNDNTNVVKFFALLKKDDFQEQLCYYQGGIGTWYNPGVVSPLFQWGAKYLDLAFAWYLDAHVMDGYRFLMQNYRVGDRICIFGFSRGAYTARALAGALYKVGLLPRDNQEQIPFAYKLYKREDEEGIRLCAGFKQTYCNAVKVEFMGVWDTVSSVGVLAGRNLPFTNSNKLIKTFRHALSLDEHRAKFRPNYYHRPAPNAAGGALDPEHASPVLGGDSPTSTDSDQKNLIPSKHLSFFRQFSNNHTRWPHVQEEEEGDPTDVVEVWFTGCHGDVGGGAVLNGAPHALSNISLRWMVREVMIAQCGIQFDEAALVRASIPVLATPPASPFEASPQELELDRADALEPLHDNLKSNVLWWLLELIPLQFSYQAADGVWHKNFEFHLGKGRKIVDPRPKFHVTVQQRMSAESGKYTPKARWSNGSQVYVE